MDFDGNSKLGPGSDEHTARGKEIIARLRAGKLPQMVDWFDPGLLAKVGVRSVISATLGSYTDQRLIQASTDNVSEERLQQRYNYSGVGMISSGATTTQYVALPSEPDGELSPNLGDGLMAQAAALG